MWRMLVQGVAGLALMGLARAGVAVEKPDPGRTYIVNRQGELEYQTKEIVFTGGDGGALIDETMLAQQTINRAIGRGIVNYKTRQPDCILGHTPTLKLRVRWDEPATGPGKSAIVNTTSSLAGVVENGPRPSRKNQWMLINLTDQSILLV